VAPVPAARESLNRLRHLGIRLGVVSNQSGVGSGRLSMDQVQAVNARVEQLLGPFDVWRICPHARDAGCGCRKPAPRMVKDACAELGIDPTRTVVVGDIGADVEAAAAAGASGILVPTAMTRPAEVTDAPQLAADLSTAVDRILAGRW
jgi:HAD superfamily hydrolase (TIGR01662 family)